MKRRSKGIHLLHGSILRFDETLAALEKSAKSAKATFVRGGVEVVEGG